MFPRLTFVALAAVSAISGCGRGQAGSRSGNGYQEYECPAPIGKIVREDCPQSGLRYEGTSFQGSVGVGGVGASASYRETAIREADALVAMLKEQRVELCNNFNTCKMTVAEYRSDQQRLDDSFVALLALKDKMAQLDAEGAAKLLEEIRRIRDTTRSDAQIPAAAGGTPPAPLISSIDVDRRSLRGGEVSSGKVKYAMAGPGDGRLDARSSVPGYRFWFAVTPVDSEADIKFGCYPDRDPHVVDWAITLTDSRGRVSNAASLSISCSGRQ